MSTDWNPQMVDRDGNPVESRPDMAGEHREDDQEHLGSANELGYHPTSKWPTVREALLKCETRRVTPAQLAEGYDVSAETCEKWLDILVSREITGRVRTQTHDGRRNSTLYGVPEDADDVLPEVLQQ